MIELSVRKNAVHRTERASMSNLRATSARNSLRACFLPPIARAKGFVRSARTIRPPRRRWRAFGADRVGRMLACIGCWMLDAGLNSLAVRWTLAFCSAQLDCGVSSLIIAGGGPVAVGEFWPPRWGGGYCTADVHGAPSLKNRGLNQRMARASAAGSVTTADRHPRTGEGGINWAPRPEVLRCNRQRLAISVLAPDQGLASLATGCRPSGADRDRIILYSAWAWRPARGA